MRAGFASKIINPELPVSLVANLLATIKKNKKFKQLSS